MHENDELLINSEIIWTFENVDKELLGAYPNGKSLTENIITIDGLYTWKIDFYPNGKDSETVDKIYVSLTLAEAKSEATVTDVDAECNYYIINKGLNRNYAGKIERRKFTTYLTEYDASFENSLLRECENSCLITFAITQFPKVQEVNEVNEENTQTKTLAEASSATPVYSSNENDDEDFQKVTVKPLH
jgi:hypothetical protein